MFKCDEFETSVFAVQVELVITHHDELSQQLINQLILSDHWLDLWEVCSLVSHLTFYS